MSDDPDPNPPRDPELLPPPGPLGAPGDILRPTGRVQPLGAPIDLADPSNTAGAGGGPAPPADASKDKAAVRIGVALALGLVPAFILSFQVAELLARASDYRVDYANSIFVLPFSYVVGVHVYAGMAKRPRILAGFWTTTLVLVAVFVVSCFAIVAWIFSNY